MDKASLIFCAGTLCASLLISAIAIPLSSISDATLARAKSVVAAEDLGEMDLGDFGKVSVKDMADYYVQNPPVEPAGGVRKVRFEGC